MQLLKQLLDRQLLKFNLTQCTVVEQVFDFTSQALRVVLPCCPTSIEPCLYMLLLKEQAVNTNRLICDVFADSVLLVAFFWRL